VRLWHRVVRAQAAHEVHLGYSDDQATTDQELDAIRRSIPILSQQVQHALEDLAPLDSKP
jgi:hypothetical protein